MNFPYDKASLLAYIQALPDDLRIADPQISWARPERSDFDYSISDWKSANGYSPILGGRYTREVENRLVFRLVFDTTDEGWFKRTYENPDGSFSNIRQIGHCKRGQ